MKQSKKPVIEATGGIHIGKSFIISFQASWPFGKIEIYDDRIVLQIQYLPDFILRLFQLASKIPMMMAYKNIPRKIEFTYDKIKSYKYKNASTAGQGITIIHTDPEKAPFIQVWVSRKKAKEIINYFNNKNIYEQTSS
jgi:hypothetical protein